MFKVTYQVRVVENGKTVLKRRFLLKDKAVNFMKDKLVGRRRVTITRTEQFVMKVFQNTAWIQHAHSGWTNVTNRLPMIFIHTSVTKQLPESATIEQERVEMRGLDAIAHGRDFNGFSYSWAVFPSGRVWEGRGWGVVEAASAPLNTESDSIVLVGNNDAHKPTAAQWESVRRLIEKGQAEGELAAHGLDVRGHREIAPKACPGRFVTDEMLADLQASVNK